MKKKRRLKKTVKAKLIILIFLTGIIYSSISLFKWKNNVEDNNKIKKRIDDNIKIVKNKEKDSKEYKIDFKSVKKLNSDVIAYLKVNNTNIDYFVVKGSDNDYYLKHNFEKKSNVAGWIFADYRNKFDETDNNIIIYGHNTKDGSMFGSLNKVLKKEWQENKDNYKILLATEKASYYYQVFSTYTIIPEDYYITTYFSSDDEYDKFLKKLKSRSIYDYKVDIQSNDKILTLSSCLGDGKKRVVLHAKLIKNNDI